jgi:amino acid transporter
MSPTLRRALGRWDLTAIGVNQVIGGAIFLAPSEIAREIGAWSVPAFLMAGLASMLVALSFAEVGSRFESTGGPYLYTRAAFGRFAAFEVGWMQWFTRVASQASIVNGLALALAYYWPSVATGASRMTLITAVTVALTAINLRGIRQSAWVVNALTIGKLVPLALFVLLGVFFIESDRLIPAQHVTAGSAATAALMLIFLYGGYDVVPVPAGEAREPRRHVPFALISTIVIATTIFTLIQIVATGVLFDLAATRTPLADAAFAVAGSTGALLIGIGSVVSMTGNNAGQVLTGSRMIFALAENGELPRSFAWIHPRFRTPAVSILFTSSIALVLALTGSFAVLAIASAVSRLITYTGVCASTLVLRSSRFATRVPPPTFVTPFGALVPVLAIAVSLMILGGASASQLAGGAAALAAGGLLFLITSRWSIGVSHPAGAALDR